MPSYLMICSLSCLPQVMSSVFMCLQVFGASITDAILSHDMLIITYASGYVKCFLVFTGVFGASITDAFLSHDMLIVMYASGYVQCFLVFTGVWGQYNRCYPIS